MSDEYCFHILVMVTKTQGTLCTAMRIFILLSSAIQRTLTCTCKAKSILTSGKLRFPLNICGGPVATVGPWAQVWDVDVAEGAMARS